MNEYNDFKTPLGDIDVSDKKFKNIFKKVKHYKKNNKCKTFFFNNKIFGKEISSMFVYMISILILILIFFLIDISFISNLEFNHISFMEIELAIKKELTNTYINIKTIVFFILYLGLIFLIFPKYNKYKEYEEIYMDESHFALILKNIKGNFDKDELISEINKRYPSIEIIDLLPLQHHESLLSNSIVLKSMEEEKHRLTKELNILTENKIENSEKNKIEKNLKKLAKLINDKKNLLLDYYIQSEIRSAILITRNCKDIKKILKRYRYNKMMRGRPTDPIIYNGRIIYPEYLPQLNFFGSSYTSRSVYEQNYRTIPVSLENEIHEHKFILFSKFILLFLISVFGPYLLIVEIIPRIYPETEFYWLFSKTINILNNYFISKVMGSMNMMRLSRRYFKLEKRFILNFFYNILILEYLMIIYKKNPDISISEGNEAYKIILKMVLFDIGMFIYYNSFNTNFYMEKWRKIIQFKNTFFSLSLTNKEMTIFKEGRRFDAIEHSMNFNYYLISLLYIYPILPLFSFIIFIFMIFHVIYARFCFLIQSPKNLNYFSNKTYVTSLLFYIKALILIFLRVQISSLLYRDSKLNPIGKFNKAFKIIFIILNLLVYLIGDFVILYFNNSNDNNCEHDYHECKKTFQKELKNNKIFKILKRKFLKEGYANVSNRSSLMK